MKYQKKRIQVDFVATFASLRARY